MKTAAALLSIVLAIFFHSAFAESADTDIEQATQAIQSGDKATAWELLSPLAKKQNKEAQFQLAQLMLNSPDVSDNIGRGLFWLQQAIKNKHTAAQAYYTQVITRPEVRQYLDETRVDEALTEKASPSPPDSPETRDTPEIDPIDPEQEHARRVADAKAQGDPVPDSTVFVNVFFDEFSETVSKIIRLDQAIRGKTKKYYEFTYFYSFEDFDKLKSLDAPSEPGIIAPDRNLIPERGGLQAKREGVTRLPGISILLPIGEIRRPPPSRLRETLVEIERLSFQ